LAKLHQIQFQNAKPFSGNMPIDILWEPVTKTLKCVRFHVPVKLSLSYMHGSHVKILLHNSSLDYDLHATMPRLSSHMYTAYNMLVHAVPLVIMQIVK